MNSPRSLTTFFDRNHSEALNTCDREQIHLVNSIQGNAGLLALEPETLKIIGHSTNLPDMLGAPVGNLLGHHAGEVDARLAAELAQLQPAQTGGHELLDFSLTHGGTSYDAISHQHAGVRFVELLPNAGATALDARQKLRKTNAACARILRSSDWESALQLAADTMREITGFARVKVYRFLSDWSGEVVAESREAHLPPYLGLRFPATDVPRQVREIMAIIPCRGISSLREENVEIISSEPLDTRFDLTWALSRSVSKMHMAYLRNMGIEASFSCSLMQKGQLWGLMAAHHTDPALIPYDDWFLLQEIGSALMLRQEQQDRIRTVEKITELRRIENSFAGAMRQNGDAEEAIRMLIPILQDFLGADGFAFQYGTKLYLSGQTPPRDFIARLLRWVGEKTQGHGHYHSAQLHKDWPPAAQHMETACGVLVQPIVMNRVSQLVWFRGPVSRKVSWAGKPDEDEKNLPGQPEQEISPRKSFDRWIQDHRDQCLPWQRSELESAKEIFSEFIDILTAQLLLKEENLTLRQFAESAAHDMKAPLRGISMALELMHEEDFDQSIVKETHALAASSARRLTMLTNGLLELAVIRERGHDFARTRLGDVVDGACEMLRTQIEECGATITHGALPTVVGNERLILRLFLNLLGNALKYRHPDRPQQVDVSLVTETDQFVEIAVTDIGLGIPPDAAERIFKPMQRLHGQDEIEGSGLGLTICERIIAIHQGTLSIDPDYTDGARFLIRLSKALDTAA